MTDRKKKKNDFSPFRFSMAELPTQCVCWLHPSSKEKRKRERKREREREVSHFPPGFGGWVLLFFSFHFVSFQFFFRPTLQKLPGRKVRFVAPRPLIKENGARGCCAVVVVVVVVVAVVGVAAVGGGGHRDGAEAGSRAEPSRP